MKDHEARLLRGRFARCERGRGKRYPRELRERATAWAERQVAAGVTIAAIARAIGMDPERVRRWLLPTSRRVRQRDLVQVAVVPAVTATRTMSVIAPTGYRVDGLSVEDAVALLRALV